MNYCYCGQIHNFLKISEDEWMGQMSRNLYERYKTAANQPLMDSWRDCFQHLQREFSKLPNDYLNLYIVFEYGVPSADPRYATRRYPRDRADVIIWDKKTALVLEFKREQYLPKNDYREYERQLHNYYKMINEVHRYGKNQKVESAFVFTNCQDEMNIIPREWDYGGTYYICSQSGVSDLICKIFDCVETMSAKEFSMWIGYCFN